MGQSQTQDITPSPQVKWKAGKRTNAIPCSITDISTFEKLAVNSDFKEYLYQNIDSDHLMWSLIDATASDCKVLLCGIKAFKSMELDNDQKDQFLSRIKKFKSTSHAGIKVMHMNIHFKHNWIMLSFAA